MKKYQYFGINKAKAMVPLFETIAEVDPTPSDVSSIYQELVRQQGLGTPRPTHFTAVELHEITDTDDGEEKPVLLHSDGMVH